jgi:hypothetical protein
MEMDGSFDVLLFLVLEHPSVMASFSVFIKVTPFLDAYTDIVCKQTLFLQGILDYVANLNMGQIRKLYCMLSNLTVSSSDDDSIVQVSMQLYA